MLTSRRSPLRPDRCGPAVVLAFSFTLMAQASAAIDLTSVDKIAGQWDLSLNDTNRRCRLVLRPDQVGPGLALGLPAGCRRALPLLSEVGTWSFEPGKHVAFADTTGKEVLSFAPDRDGLLLAKGPEGETYRLGRRRRRRARPALWEFAGRACAGFRDSRPTGGRCRTRCRGRDHSACRGSVAPPARTRSPAAIRCCAKAARIPAAC